LIKKTVLIHKTPASWKRANLFAHNDLLNQNILMDVLCPLEENYVPQDIVYTDIYTSLLGRVSKKLQFDELHIVQGFDPHEKRNWQSAGKPGFVHLNDKITYWSIDEPNHLAAFLDADLLFTRGNYLHLHQEFEQYRTSKSSVWVHYPATSEYFPHVERFLRTWRDRLDKKWSVESRRFLPILEALEAEHRSTGVPFLEQSAEGEVLMSPDVLYNKIQTFEELCMKQKLKVQNSPYDIVLFDDAVKKNYFTQKYPNSMPVTFTKPSLNRMIDVSLVRKWDLVFCGSTLQPTKNHMVFGNLLRYLDQMTDTKIRIIVIGNMGGIPAFDRLISKNYMNLDIENRGLLSRSETLEIFNHSRALLVTSGRDCNPRIISEATMHGARIIALDLLSDGFEIIKSTPSLGAVVSTSTRDWFYARNGNVKCLPNENMAKEILNELRRSNAPLVTAHTAEHTFNLSDCADKLATTILSVI
tara:strand:- start:58 stop:1470 length:1413 start_codon:yes stop_codon:yes gene_type:complete